MYDALLAALNFLFGIPVEPTTDDSGTGHGYKEPFP